MRAPILAAALVLAGTFTPLPAKAAPSFPAMPPNAHAAQACRLHNLVRVPLELHEGIPVVNAQLNDVPMGMVVDTGSEGSLLTPQALVPLHLVSDGHDDGVIIQGSDGRSHLAPLAHIGSLRLAQGRDEWALDNVTMPIGVLSSLPPAQPPVMGLLGMDVLGRHDIEMDLPGHSLTIWDVRSQSLLCPVPPPWQGIWRHLPARRSGDRIMVPFTLDGQSGLALIDSGARSLVLSTRFAHRLGVNDATLARDPGGRSKGLGTKANDWHWHRFHNLDIAGQDTPTPVLTVAPLALDEPDMLLGTAWLKNHVVWIPARGNEVYVLVAGPGGVPVAHMPIHP
ncbi:aspartyl protease family protein [Formicincola oecophyllae]|nr:retroviral-like aspartic protease family protein [Formicincola oecophyllae]